MRKFKAHYSHTCFEYNNQADNDNKNTEYNF